MTLNELIHNNWKTDIVGYAQDIPGLKESGYAAWTIKYEDSYGAAIPYSGSEIVNETFASAKLYSTLIPLQGGTPVSAIVLKTGVPDIAVPFATLCEALVDPGRNGERRREIELSPVAWWKEWKELLGNRNIDDRIYDILGELCVLRQLIESGEEPEWNGPTGASYDIELTDRFVEVKSSTVRDKREVTISSQFQLDPPDKALDLVFCQFEPTVQTGESIDSVVDWFAGIGYNISALNEKLASKGFEIGMSSRKRTFLLHSMLKYTVDKTFPRITPASFVGGAMPAGITKISYTVDLGGLVPESMLQGVTDEI